LETPTPLWLERANRLALIARHLSTTIHDVNNMLQVISGHAELLVKAPGATEVMLRRGQAIGTQAQRATIALAELAAFAKDVNDQTETVGLRAVAEQALGMRAHALAKLRLSPKVEGDELRVRGNSRRLLQIALNLIVTAEQAMAGTPAPRLRVRVAAVGECAELTVEHNGTGASATPDLYDLGVDLEVSRWLADQQGGSLEHVSLTDGGARATLSMPGAASIQA
jgi:two-component system C4-dicarboxylate transport sensor histidine kinase DctB